MQPQRDEEDDEGSGASSWRAAADRGDLPPDREARHAMKAANQAARAAATLVGAQVRGCPGLSRLVVHAQTCPPNHVLCHLAAVLVVGAVLHTF